MTHMLEDLTHKMVSVYLHYIHTVSGIDSGFKNFWKTRLPLSRTLQTLRKLFPRGSNPKNFFPL